MFIDQEAAATERAVAADGGLSRHTVRAKLAKLDVACDVRTRAPLYEYEHDTTVLAKVKPRPARCAGAQRVRQAANA